MALGTTCACFLCSRSARARGGTPIPLASILADSFALSRPPQTAEALIQYGALIVRDGRVSEAANERFLDVMESYFAQDEERLKEDERPQYHYQGAFAPRPILSELELIILAPARSRRHAREHGEGPSPSSFVPLDPSWPLADGTLSSDTA